MSPDETGWKVGGELVWLWAFATPQLSVYTIQDGRGFPQAAPVLGPDFAGTLIRDGWAPYRRFEEASHQSCLAHLLRRCHEMIGSALAGAARFPHAVRRLLQKGLDLRDDALLALAKARRLPQKTQADLAQRISALNDRVRATTGRSR